MNAKVKSILFNYFKSTDSELHQVYKNPSEFKQIAFQKIIDEYRLVTVSKWYVFRPKILTHNAMQFTMAFILDAVDSGKMFLYYYTKSGRRIFEFTTKEFEDVFNEYSKFVRGE